MTIFDVSGFLDSGFHGISMYKFCYLFIIYFLVGLFESGFGVPSFAMMRSCYSVHEYIFLYMLSRSYAFDGIRRTRHTHTSNGIPGRVRKKGARIIVLFECIVGLLYCQGVGRLHDS